MIVNALSRWVTLTLAALVACAPARVRRTLVPSSQISTLDKKSPYLKAHLRTGYVYILDSWQVDSAGTTRHREGIASHAESLGRASRRLRDSGRLGGAFRDECPPARQRRGGTLGSDRHHGGGNGGVHRESEDLLRLVPDILRERQRGRAAAGRRVFREHRAGARGHRCRRVVPGSGYRSRLPSEAEERGARDPCHPVRGHPRRATAIRRPGADQPGRSISPGNRSASPDPLRGRQGRLPRCRRLHSTGGSE